MKKLYNNIFLFLLLIVFCSLFIFSNEIKTSVLASCELWFYNLVPSMLPMYLILDLLINYGLATWLYKLFRTNSIILIFISLISGTPGNAKYIKEFYMKGFISKDLAEYLLAFAYSPNPLFIIAISSSIKNALIVLSIIYLTDFINFLFFRIKFKNRRSNEIKNSTISFSTILESSISKSANILVLVLGIVVAYGIINTLLSICHINSPFITSIFELTNALSTIRTLDAGLCWTVFACLFAGLSIHTQIKSILEGTEISYKYFLYGRIIASLPFLILAIVY